MINRRKGFTLAETLITITAIAVLAAITLPILNKAKADEDTVVYRKGMYTLQRGLQKFMESSDYEALLQTKSAKGQSIKEGYYLANFTGPELCQGIADQLNTKGRINCDDRYLTNFVTTDGIRFGNISAIDMNDGEKNAFIIIYLDSVKGPTKDQIRKRVGMNGQDFGSLRVWLNYRGKVYVPTLPTTEYERTLISDFTKMKN